MPIDDEDLTHGLKTSFHKIKRLATQRLYALRVPKVSVNLPAFPIDLNHPSVHQITTSDRLLQESSTMNHCVVNYYQKCQDQRCWIFHVDDGSVHGVTAEVVFDINGFTIEQMQSYLSSSITEARTILQQVLDTANASEQGKKLINNYLRTLAHLGYPAQSANLKPQVYEVQDADGVVHVFE